MNLLTLLRESTLHEQIMATPTLMFKNKETYPILFFSLLWEHVKKQSIEVMIEHFSWVDTELDELKRKSSISFLGMPIIHWLGDISVLESKKRAALLAYLKTYQGPHHIMWFDTNQESSSVFKVNTIDIPEVVDREMVSALLRLLDVPITPRVHQFFTILLKKYPALSLDTACLLLHYAVISGNSDKQFFEQWADQIIITQASLFTLSQLFFMKDARNFFVQWHRVKDTYAEQFWISFWSDQLWRASFFIALQKKQQPVLAKKISYRLPFKFIEHNWRTLSVAELKHAHQFLYTLDYRMKNGSSDLGFDLFFNTFFCNKFMSSDA